jgi:soluble lytic murein transglycosylase-like protein
MQADVMFVSEKLFTVCCLRRWLVTRAAAWSAVGALLCAPCLALEPEGIFLIEDASGAIHLGDGRARGSEHGLLIVETRSLDSRSVEKPQSAALAAPFVLQRGDLATIVQAAARAERLDPALLHAVIGVESSYATRATSPRGALGLMQLMPATAKQYGVTDAFDPRQNVFAGARHLRVLLDQFNQNMTLALAAYNAGAAAVRRYGQAIPPFAETAAYVPKVLGHYAALRRQLTSP